MTRFQRLASTVSALAFCAFLGLGAATIAHAAPAETGATEAGVPRRGHHGHGGLLGAALHLDSLTASQRQQIEALRASEKSAHANIGAARGQLMQAVATGLAAGSIDDKALAPGVQAVEGAIAADEPRERANLEELHALLTPAQRTELVTRLESRGGRRHAGPPQNAGGRGPGGGHGGMGPFGRELGLTDAQRDQIRANLRKSAAAVDPTLWSDERAEHQRVLEAFKGDRFVMNEIAPAKDPRLIAGEAERMVRMAKASAPVLTAEQRATAAAKLRERATREATPRQ